MSESISDRVKRIISGSAHRLIDRIENSVPETAMEEAIREINGAIQEVRDSLGKKEVEKHLAEQRLSTALTTIQTLSDQIKIALKENREDLAEAAVSRQLDLEDQAPVLEKTIADCSEEIKKLEGYISAIQAKKREMREELNQIRKEKKSSDGVSFSDKGGDFMNKIDKATEAFDRIASQNVPSIGASMEDAGKLEELSEMARKNKIQERLAKIRTSE